MYQQGRLSGRTSPAAQQGRTSGRMSPATTCRLHDRLDDLFNQLKDGLKMVEAEDLVALLEELLDKIDSRMVARYGPGMLPCPKAEDCGRLSREFPPRRSPESPTRRSPVSWEAPSGGAQFSKTTKENARKIVINAVTNALVQASTEQTPTQSAGGKAYATSASYGTSYTTGQSRTRSVTRQADYTRQAYSGVRPPTKARDVTERDILAMQTVDAGESESNRAYVLRREARSSLVKYSPRPEALLNTMPQVARQSEDAFYDAFECQASRQSSKDSGQESRICEMSASDSPHREERMEASRGLQYRDLSPTRVDKSSSVSPRESASQSPQNVFSIAKTTPCQTFKRIQAPRLTKDDESYKWPDRCQTRAEEPKEVEKDSSDEDIWYNARDRFSSSTLIKCPLKHIAAKDAEEFVPVQLHTDEKRQALLKDQSMAVVPKDACKDTNLIFSVNRTLRQSLPKFTGSARRTRGLLHLVSSVLSDEPVEEYYPDINYAELEELKGDESHELTAGDASRTYMAKQTTYAKAKSAAFRDTTQQTRYTDARSSTFQDSVQRLTGHSQTTRPEYTRARQELLKVVKDSKENIKVEFSLPKEDQPQLAKFVSTFIDAQRKGQSQQTETHTQTYGCAQCGRSFASPPIEPSQGNSFTTNNNRSSKSGSPVRSLSPSQATSKSSSKGSSPRSRSPFKTVQFGSVSPSPSVGSSSAHESESASFKPSKFLEQNNMYSNRMETTVPAVEVKRMPAVEVQRVEQDYEPERGKAVENKGSFLGEICGCN